uniref:NADH dehydrogenase subunit 2 n=1 Tax=Philagra albinotata TaxID=868271 RepID=UPI00255209E1|nr:NADH dehydrogenase subunit 2 [Philagra albinotata]WGL39470.1 NADH dehydrogenase subunit 2 [Philagra albinotata]
MIMNSTKMLFYLFLFFGSLISLSSNNWMSSWIGIEINMISFLPLIYNKINYYSSESSMKYFIIQSMSSSMLLMGVILSSFEFLYLNNSFLIMVSLMIKLGCAPFHFWLPGVMEGLNWINCLLLSTWQKIALLFLLSYIMINLFIFIPVMMSLIFGSIGGINQSSLSKIISYSSINNLGWIMMSMIISNSLWMNYFIYYSMMIFMLMYMLMKFEINYLMQMMVNSFCSFNKLFFFSLFFSLGGLPPMLGFIPKWMVIQSMIWNDNLLICFIMVISSLITLFYYIRMMLMILFFNSIQLKWNNILIKENLFIYLFSFINMFGFFIVLLLKSLN